MPANADGQAQRAKLASSYRELLDEFSSTDLRTVGNYTLGKLIGKGSFGKVYLASHKLTNGSKVVLKSAKKEDANLAREIHHHRQFLHPHIARLYEVIVTEHLVWLVLEYCPGDELYNYLLEHGPLEPAKVQKIFTQLVGAVTYVHSKSCVHRDLKLENILLDKHENVKLVDFGFTREYEGKASYLQTWCGTVCYSAPEMLKGEKYAGEKVDIWSLGIILYALLCGELPFDEDDEGATRVKILKQEPQYPEHIPPQAKDLMISLLSKRPLRRPTFSDILANPWLAEYAPHQQAILKLQQPAPFTTELERETLQRMRSAGVDIDMVIDHVLSQRCDALAGWWALLIEKEERKAKRRERKRKEKEAEARSLRRLSAASGRLERIAPTIREMDEEGSTLLSEPSNMRGRNPKRSAATSALGDVLPRLLEQHSPGVSQSPPPPPPIEKDSVRGSSSSRPRPAPPPKEHRISRNSTLQLVSANPELLSPNGFVGQRRRRYQPSWFHQFASIKHWIKESAKRAKSPNTKAQPPNVLSPKEVVNGAKSDSRRGSAAGGASRDHRGSISRRPDIGSRSNYMHRPRISTTPSAGSLKQRPSPSLSPSPLTPRSSYRRSSHGLRGRKSTSSSVSSIRSVHHVHSHSKASSTSSASINMASPAGSSQGKNHTRSPHNSIKILPATPTSTAFPLNIRAVRGPLSESSAAFGNAPPPSPGLVFAKRKRSPFKGPMLAISSHGGSQRSRSDGQSRSSSVQGRQSGEVIEEEDEEDDEVEEVEAFSPTGPDEFVEIVSDMFGLHEKRGP